MAAVVSSPHHLLHLKVEEPAMSNLFALVAAVDRQRRTNKVFESTVPPSEIIDLDAVDREVECSVCIDLDSPPSSTRRVQEIGNENLQSATKRRRSDGLIERGQSATEFDTNAETPPPSSSDHSLLPLQNTDSTLFDFNNTTFVQHQSLRKLTPKQLEQVKEAVTNAASEVSVR